MQACFDPLLCYLSLDQRPGCRAVGSRPCPTVRRSVKEKGWAGGRKGTVLPCQSHLSPSAQLYQHPVERLLLPGVSLERLPLLGSVLFAREAALLLSLVNEHQHSIQHPPNRRKYRLPGLRQHFSDHPGGEGALLQPAPIPYPDPGNFCC